MPEDLGFSKGRKKQDTGLGFAYKKDKAKAGPKLELPPGALRMILIGAGCLAALIVVIVALNAFGVFGGTGGISGRVLFEGKPLPNGRITFINTSGRAQTESTHIEADGTYKIARFPTGDAVVTVETFDMRKVKATKPPDFTKNIRDSVHKDKVATPDLGMGGMGGLVKMPSEEKMAEYLKGNISAYVKIPDRYRDVNQTDLRYRVRLGPNTIDIELKP